MVNSYMIYIDKNSPYVKYITNKNHKFKDKLFKKKYLLKYL